MQKQKEEQIRRNTRKGQERYVNFIKIKAVEIKSKYQYLYYLCTSTNFKGRLSGGGGGNTRWWCKSPYISLSMQCHGKTRRKQNGDGKKTKGHKGSLQYFLF